MFKTILATAATAFVAIALVAPQQAAACDAKCKNKKAFDTDALQIVDNIDYLGSDAAALPATH